ncbi:tetratricopeptide repeat protein [Kutzneria sp. NPDC052558]|uniref:tetratricopeptide repeat protein n=1 Tax=Kutzneria sp. NPDC052558 TaxID=3364121 RepID=UPI0037CC5521
MRAVRRRAVLGGLLTAAVLGTTLVVPPQASAAIDQNALANVLVGDYVRVADKDRDYAKDLVTSAELLDWRAAHPEKDEKAQADHAAIVLTAIDKALPDGAAMGQDYEIAGAALIALHGVPDAMVTGPKIDKLMAALLARDTRPLSGKVMDRLSSSLQVYSWNVGYETAQSEVWAGVASTARADAKFDNAWFTALGSRVGGGFRAKSSAVQISAIPEFQKYFDAGQFLKLENQPDQLKLFTLDKMREQISATETEIKNDMSKMKDAKPDPGKTQEQLNKEQQGRQEIIDGAKSAFDGLAWFLGATGDPGAARDLKAFANGAIQVATAVNKCITAFQAISAVVSLATVAFTGNVIGAITTLVGLFGGAGPDINKMILDEIHSLRLDIQQLHSDMLTQFERIDQRLSDMYTRIDEQMTAIDAKVDVVKHNIDAIVGQLVSLDSRFRTLGADTAKGFQGVLVQPTLQNADTVIDYRLTHPTEPVTEKMYADADQVFHLAGTQTPATPGVFIADAAALDIPTALDQLAKYGPHGAMNYLANLANAKWAANIGLPDQTGNPDMWKLSANALTLMMAQNPALARSKGSLTWAKEVLGQGRDMVAAAQKFGRPGQDGGTSALFTGLAGEYTKELVDYFTKQIQPLERSITVDKGFPEYNLWAGPTQSVTPIDGTDADDQVSMCNSGDLSKRIDRPNTMKGSDLPTSTLLARNIFGPRPGNPARVGYPKRPGYSVCWYASFENEHESTVQYECPVADHSYTCTEVTTYDDLEVQINQTTCFDDCSIEGPDRASRWGKDVVKKSIMRKRCVTSSQNGFTTCHDFETDPREVLLRDWKSTYRNLFEQSATITVSEPTEAEAKARVTAFLKDRQADYYRLAASETNDKKLAEPMTNVVRLMRAYTDLAFPRSSLSDDQLRGLLYGNHLLIANFPAGEGQQEVLNRTFLTAAANVVKDIPAWKSDQFDGPDGRDCERLPGLTSADPFVVCMAWNAKLRLDKLGERLAAHFKQPTDESLPDTQNQLRNLWLAIKTTYPDAGDLGGPIDPAPTTVQVDADYDGDHKTDSAFWRPADGTWSVQPRTGGPTQTVHLGQPGDLPVPADYDGSGKAQPAVVRPSESRFYARQLSGDTPAATQEWLRPDYKPVPADYGKMQLLAQRLSTLAFQFANGGKGTDAPTPQTWSRDIYRKLAQADPGFRSSLAHESVVLGSLLDGAGRKQEAIAPSQEGVDLYRALGDKPNLAWALNNLAYRFSAAGRTADAPVAQRESRDVYRALGDPYRSQLASASVILGSFDQSAGLHDEAVTVSREGADIFRALGDKPQLAWALTNLAYRLSAAGKAADAPTPAQEARDIYRSLGSAYRSQAANAAVLLGSFLTTAGRHDEAIAAAREGVDGYRQLGDQVQLAWALNNLGFRCSAAGKPADAVTAERESRDIYRTLAKADLRTYQPYWAEAAFLLGSWLKQANQLPEARTAAQEAVDQFTVLAAANPGYATRLKDAQTLRASLG